MTKIYKVMEEDTNGGSEQVYPETSTAALIGYAGTTPNRPTEGLTVGAIYFDTTLGKPIWYNGSSWIDATGSKI